MKITIYSFGFKHGYPEADMVWDVRFLPNPYWEPELRDHTGLETEVASYVLENEVGQRFIEHLKPFVSFFLNSHKEAGREELTLAVGCTGGRHRSVAVTDYVQKFLTDAGFELDMYHRDIKKD